jgi:hypothetical protein
MNKKINITLHLLLIIALISSMGTVNACFDCICTLDLSIRANEEAYHPHLRHIYVYEKSVKQGKTLKIPAILYSEMLFGAVTPISSVPIHFTLRDPQDELITDEIIKTGKHGWITFEPAIFQYNTTNLHTGKYTLYLNYYPPNCPIHNKPPRVTNTKIIITIK